MAHKNHPVFKLAKFFPHLGFPRGIVRRFRLWHCGVNHFVFRTERISQPVYKIAAAFMRALRTAAVQKEYRSFHYALLVAAFLFIRGHGRSDSHAG
jgi:hypothetical protein